MKAANNKTYRIQIVLLNLACTAVMLLAFCASSEAQNLKGLPVKYLSSCEIDLNKDDLPDYVFFIETSEGRKLLTLTSNGSNYETNILMDRIETWPNTHLSCNYGTKVWTLKNGRANKKHPVNIPTGVYVQISFPESSAVCFYWTDTGFKELWLND